MRFFTIGDLHLSHQVEKPMDVFGGHWTNHAAKVRENWLSQVEDGDIVIMPGDFSWATYLAQAEEDFRFLDSLPGRKLMLKGNHDYWWETVTKMTKFLDQIGVRDIDFLYNKSFCFDETGFAGTKGWDYKEEKDEKIINREISRFRMSADSLPPDCKEKTAVLHYPPDENPVMMELLEGYGFVKCIYGHKHGYSEEPKRYLKHGIEFINASADQINFTPVLI